MYFWLSFIFVIAFITIHSSSKYMTFITTIPRSRYLSLAGGISVTYVFLHLLPQLEGPQELEHNSTGAFLSFLAENTYLMALIGLFIFYALDRMVKKSKKPTKSQANIFWTHIITFFLYNSLIGYLLVREEYHNVWGMVLYFLAMAGHFVIVDHNLRMDHEKAYDKYGRWLLTAAILMGWITGTLTEISHYVLSVLEALLAGGIILNVIKEELPEERQSSLSSFTIGILSYSTLILLME